jgi:hypothetical protein
MKKITVIAVFLFLVGVILSGQALAQMALSGKVTPITKANMATLKGTWQGSVDWDNPGASGSNVTMVISNDAPPFKGTLEIKNLPSPSVMTFPGNMQGASTMSGPFENGVISPKGYFVITGQGGNFGEYAMVGNDLQGWFYLWGAKGTMTLKKAAEPKKK